MYEGIHGTTAIQQQRGSRRIIAGLICAWLLSLTAPAAAQSAPPAWLERGWQLLAAGNQQRALHLWQRGVSALPEHQLLATLGVFAHLPYALQRLKQLGPGYQTLIARRNRHGRTLYYLLSSLPTSADRRRRQSELADLKQAAGISGVLLAVEAGAFRNMAAPPEADPATPERSFTINRFEISGNRQLSTDLILMSLRDFYGSDKTDTDLALIRQQVLELYRSSDIRRVEVAAPTLLDDTVSITIREQASP